jgi:hypothetical protein
LGALILLGFALAARDSYPPERLHIMKPFTPESLRKEVGKFIEQIGTEKPAGKGLLGKLMGR